MSTGNKLKCRGGLDQHDSISDSSDSTCLNQIEMNNIRGGSDEYWSAPISQNVRSTSVKPANKNR